jgi:hypothetical protein
MGAMPESPVDVPAMSETEDVQPEARVSFIAGESDHDARKVDDVAGSEFVDDRIRLRE